MSCRPNLCPISPVHDYSSAVYVPVAIRFMCQFWAETEWKRPYRVIGEASVRQLQEPVRCLFARCGSGPWFSQIAQLSNRNKLLWTEYAFTQARTGVRMHCQGVRRSMYKGRLRQEWLRQELVGSRSTRVHFSGSSRSNFSAELPIDDSLHCYLL